MENLFYLVYASKASGKMADEEVITLLEKARVNNQELGVTGMLLYTGQTFFQVLEGEEVIVKALFRKICQDSRHEDTVKIFAEETEHRQFADWSMGYARLTPAEIENTPGLNDFFDKQGCIAELDEGRVKKLLHGFSEGQWRQD